MLSEATLKEWSVKWQTTELNVVREYLQHLFLSSLYQHPASDKLAFKGGTALRIAFGSPRFSEDLDFTAELSVYHLEKILQETIKKMAASNVPIVVTETKPTSGGYLVIYQIDAYGHPTTLAGNFSFRKRAHYEAVLIATPLLPAYQCLLLRTEDLVGEKVQALLSRKKQRDFFDLYFLLRERRGVKAIIKEKGKLLRELKTLDSRSVHKELKIFLPVSYHRIVTNLDKVLRQELEKL